MSTVTEPDQVEPTRDGLLEERRTAALDHAAFDVALADAVRVCAMFNAMDRCADALGFDPTTASPPEIFLTRGYAAMFKAAAPPS
ncbi:MAG TPA: hypothetical protein DIT48_03755 [Actinobacteria bacterium]|nr:hypothetical protein [Actinomycetota bacterium]